MATKRACPEAATVLSLPHVLASIAQCLQSPSAALAFLSALPLTSLDTALAATKELLTRPGPFIHTWPHLGLDDIHGDRAALALEALPALLFLQEPETERTDRSMSETDTVILADVVASWPLKVTYFDTQWSHARDARYPRTIDSDVVGALLRRCTRLRSVTLSARKDVAKLLAAMTTPAHRVEKLCLEYEGDETLDWTSLLRPWLATGHARHLSFNNAGTTDIKGLALALATASSLTGLGIDNNNALVRAIVALQMPLHQLREVHLRTHGPKSLRAFVQLCDLTKLTSLALACNGYFANVMSLVSRMPALRHLSLSECTLRDDAGGASHWPHLKSIELFEVNFERDACKAILAYLARVQGLQKITLHSCHDLCRGFVGRRRNLLRLINNGLTLASFESTWIDDSDATHLVRVLRQIRNPLPLTLDLTVDDFTMAGIRSLVDVLTTCTAVCIKIDIPPDTYEEEFEPFLATHGMASVLEGACSYALYSPPRMLT
ncbi:hypothetical protein SPRG_07644 [Saprolegnia parasitica CBS 223.65]|uniref:Uncharacterized protein n=1 Tax=Saprolegnia parasitica (strain CBS 223.65) TaxID=695850 RepID=A0A067CCL4_SAPPC|nr:hypothetical protein SPRG_07644 [Saprolegnia parasitica CBS 223.65]KDO26930.1 hypothetical protein SPRG_07644 [Saprolegnia parasitica CBS 223.65]|eukprot:XP_012202312.1 hypothetical protein SPRG_07644 [Saprolegnia parasitica CBS 223.65]